MKNLILGMLAVAGMGISTASTQASILQFDVNALTAQAYAGSNGTGGTSAFGGAYTGIAGQGHTGSLVLSTGTSSVLNGILINSVSQTIPTGWSLSSFTATINLVDGVVKGGGLSLSATNGIMTDSYSAMIFANSGVVAGGGFPPVNPPFSVSGLTYAGTFSGSTFAGIDVAQWFAYSGALPGNFINFEYRPNSAGFDSTVDIDIFVAIPLPSAGLMGLAGIGLVAVRRRPR
jgi:hypothetical protein